MDKGINGEGVKSVRTVFSILEYLRDNGPTGVTELSNHTGLSKGAVHRYLKTLTELGYATKEDGLYRISLKFILYSSEVKNSESVYQLAEEKVANLAEETGERAQFIAEEHGFGVYVHIKTGEDAVDTDTREGKMLNLTTAASGKVILAFSSAEWVDAVLDEHGFQERTSNTITDRERFIEELAEIRQRGYALNKEEHIEGLWGAAAPVRNPEGEVIGAISVAGPANRVKEQMQNGEIPNTILAATNELELNLRYQ